MLAKWWKKILLLICIIAIMFNIINKLVHRTNLKAELESVKNDAAIKISDDKDTTVIEEGEEEK